MIEIKEGCDEHIDDIHGLALLECEEFKFPLCIVREVIEGYIDRTISENVFARVLTVEDVVVGFIFIAKDSNMPVAMIEQLFIHPKFRGNLSFFKMLKQGEAWAKEKECQMLLIGGMSKINKEHANKLGFNHEFPYYGKELVW